MRTPARGAFVYLFVHATEPRFKIGSARDPVARLRSLPECGAVDLSRSGAYRIPDEHEARRVERILHFAFRRHRLPRVHIGDGATEWFDLDALSSAVEWLDASKPHLGWVERIGIEMTEEAITPAEPRLTDRVPFAYDFDGRIHVVYRALRAEAAPLNAMTETNMANVALRASIDPADVHADFRVLAQLFVNDPWAGSPLGTNCSYERILHLWDFGRPENPLDPLRYTLSVDLDAMEHSTASFAFC